MPSVNTAQPSKAYLKVPKKFNHDKLPLRGKLALVTGGSGTIGTAIAQALLQRGARVVITGRRRERLEETARQLEVYASTGPENIKFIPCDVADETSVEALFTEIDILLGPLDILINNAGTNVPRTTIDMNAYEFNKVMHVNVTGCFLCAREAIKRYRSKPVEKGLCNGRIVNIGSLSATRPRPDSVAYSTSKFALQGLTHSLSLDCRAYNIAVGIIHPGNVSSELLTPDMINSRQEEGFLQPSDVADSIMHMLTAPMHANVLEMTLLPTTQPFVGRG